MMRVPYLHCHHRQHLHRDPVELIEAAPSARLRQAFVDVSTRLFEWRQQKTKVSGGGVLMKTKQNIEARHMGSHKGNHNLTVRPTVVYETEKEWSKLGLFDAPI